MPDGTRRFVEDPEAPKPPTEQQKQDFIKYWKEQTGVDPSQRLNNERKDSDDILPATKKKDTALEVSEPDKGQSG